MILINCERSILVAHIAPQLLSVDFARENFADADAGLWRPCGKICKDFAPSKELCCFGGEGYVFADLTIRELLVNIWTIASCCIAPVFASNKEMISDLA